MDNFEGNEVLRTYVKIEGKDTKSIVQKLAKLAVDLPEICVWDYNMMDAGWSMPFTDEGMRSRDQMAGEMAGYFGMDSSTFKKECDKIVAKSGVDLGDNNIYFEWQMVPSDEELKTLRMRIDSILKPFGNKYTVTNRK